MREEENPMHRSPSARAAALARLAPALALLACQLPFAALSPTQTPPPTTTPSPQPTSTAAPTPTPAAPSPTPTPRVSPAPLVVVLHVSGGNLSIRRGHGLDYNILGYLSDGESALLLARDTESRWFYLEIPDRPGTFGWVAADPRYTRVEGDAQSLPVKIAEPPLPAYLRNCTFHPMLIQPGGVVIQPQTMAPENQLQVRPGPYQAFDQSVEGYPLVFTGDVREGRTVDIVTDGLHNTYACP
jgi:hypothetical protein